MRVLACGVVPRAWRFVSGYPRRGVELWTVARGVAGECWREVWLASAGGRRGWRVVELVDGWRDWWFVGRGAVGS